MDEQPDLLTVAEAADKLRVARGTIYKMIAEDVLRSVNPMEKTTRVWREDVEAILRGD